MNTQFQIAVLVAVAIVLGGGGFVAGMTVGPGLTKADAASASPAPGAAARAGAGGGVGAGFGGARVAGGGAQVAGRVLSVGDGSITIEARQPGSDQARSIIALVGGNARVVRTTETDIKVSDIKPGDQVVVVGQPDQATGVVSANAVVVGLSAFQQVFGGGQAAPSGSGAPRRASPSPSPAR